MPFALRSDPQYPDFNPTVPRSPLFGIIRRDRFCLAVGEHLDTSGEVPRRSLLKPILDRKRPLLGERHIRIRVALVIRVPMNFNNRVAGDKQTTQQFLKG